MTKREDINTESELIKMLQTSFLKIIVMDYFTIRR